MEKLDTRDLEKLADIVSKSIIITTKEVLTSDEAARYLGISKSYLYKLTMNRQIPHYKPTGKMCYFNRVKLEKWAQKYKVEEDNFEVVNVDDEELNIFCKWFKEHFKTNQDTHNVFTISLCGYFHVYPKTAALLIERCKGNDLIETRGNVVFIK